MSWGKKQFKDAYNRADRKFTEQRDAAEEERQDFFDIWAQMRSYSDECYPTVHSHTQGKLLKLLHKLNIRYAKALLDEIYW